jgi:hypothetical protein
MAIRNLPKNDFETFSAFRQRHVEVLVFSPFRELRGFHWVGLTAFFDMLYLLVRREGNDGNRLSEGCPTAAAVPVINGGFFNRHAELAVRGD